MILRRAIGDRLDNPLKHRSRPPATKHLAGPPATKAIGAVRLQPDRRTPPPPPNR